MKRLVSISGKKKNIFPENASRSPEPVRNTSNRLLGMILDGSMLRTVPQLRLSSEIEHFPSKSARFPSKSRLGDCPQARSATIEDLQISDMKNGIVANSTLRWSLPLIVSGFAVLLVPNCWPNMKTKLPLSSENRHHQYFG